MIYLWYSLSAILILAGLIGIFLPVVPGIPVVLAGILVAGFAGHFISTVGIIALVLLTLISVLIDYFSGALGAKYSGAGIWGMVGAVVGSILGFSVLGIAGIVLGPALGVLIFELLARGNVRKSARLATYTLVSVTIGIIVNVLIALTMLTIFVVAIFA